MTMTMTMAEALRILLLLLVFYYLYSLYRRSTDGQEHFSSPGGGAGDASCDQPARQMNPFGVHSAHHPLGGDLRAKVDPASSSPYTDHLDYKIKYKLNTYEKEFDDIFDPEYVDLYAIAYHDFYDVDRDVAKIREKVPLDPATAEVVVGGCGTGRMMEGLQKKGGFQKVIGIDFSKHMLTKAHATYPHFPYLRGNLVDPKVIDPNSCDLFVMDERTLYMNDGKDMQTILSNCKNWLREGGYLALPIYHRDKLQPACRYYSTNYVDNLGVTHAMTYLDHFRHDGWYIHDLREDANESTLTIYFDKFLTKKEGKKRIKTTMFNFVPPETIIQFLKENQFEKVHVEPICNQIVGGYELAIFKKGRTTSSVKGLQEKYQNKSKSKSKSKKEK
jgi:ubiquinone/menaquinone biosynthesis C-methylase UbiE